MLVCVQVNVALTTYRGPGEDDPSLGGRFQAGTGPAKVASLLGKRVRDEEHGDEDEEY